MRQPEPIIIPSLFKNDIFSISTLSMFLVGAGMFGAISYLTLFVQIVLGQTATNAGIVLTPMMLRLHRQQHRRRAADVAHRALQDPGARRLRVGALGMFLLSRMTTSTTNGELDPQHDRHRPGHRRADEPLHHHRAERLQPRHAGTGHFRLTFFRSLGASIGVAVLGAIVTNVYTSKLAASVPAPLKPYVNVNQLANLTVITASAINMKAAVAHLGPEALALFSSWRTM